MMPSLRGLYRYGIHVDDAWHERKMLLYMGSFMHLSKDTLQKI